MKKPIVIIGAQWGDEGKGKITDILSEQADAVIRFQGGNNAGHTIVAGEEVFKLHLLPSGVVYNKKCLIACGVVVDPKVLLQEIDSLEKRGFVVDLMIDPLCHIILPYHQALDTARENRLGDQKIGTTKRGIGPCYADKTNRCGIRFIDLLEKNIFEDKFFSNLEQKTKELKALYHYEEVLDGDQIFKDYLEMAEKLRSYLGDVSGFVSEHLGKSNLVFEGAQGTFLDIHFGTFPYVTSSHTISGGVFPNIGIAPCALDVIGIVKAYTTRVGSGPFLAELENEAGEHLRQVGQEFGTTTGRPRRCGWLDIVMLRYAHRLNGFTQFALTKLDVLNGLEKIQVAVDYKMDGQSVEFPLSISQLEQCTVEYKTFEGFQLPETIESYDDLPKAAQVYIEFIEAELGVPITFISTGPKRLETLLKPV